MNKYAFYSCLLASGLFLTTACSDDDNSSEDTNKETTELSEEYYAGGKLGTAFTESSFAYKQAAPVVEDDATFNAYFQRGETIFERDFGQDTTSAFRGLGPVYVRKGCLYCHPGYGHGKRQSNYRESTMGNGYLLVIYDKQTNAYIRSVAGMPQTAAVYPFKAPIDETKISIDWKSYTDEWGNKFDDGETYSLIYPEVTIPQDAYYAPIVVQRNGENVVVDASEIGVRLETTIGIYGTGLLDAIPDTAIINQWKKESPYVTLNPSYFNQETNEWVGYYTGATGKQYVRRFTYAMSRGPVLDGPGANAIWNITNVTRPDRRYHYLDLNYSAKKQTHSYYAEVSSKDPDVQKDFYTYFPKENKTGNVETDIYNYLTSTNLDAEMSQDDYKALMVWHRGLAVPAARDVDTKQFQQGKKLFTEIGCAECHRPSWTTGADEIEDPNGLFTNSDMPRFPHQKIWPYTDMVQHRLFMQNDIRTGWCRTTPLWGRGLAKLCMGVAYDGQDSRMHDCRARNTLEAIMWHGSKDSDARKSVEKFRKLSSTERAAVIKFVDSI